MSATLAAAAIGAAAQAASTLGTAALNHFSQKQARKENYEYNEMAANHALTRQQILQQYLNELQRKQFYDLESPKAIMQQLRDAGLSPSLYGSMAGGGNVSGISTAGSAPQGAGASGPGAIPITPMDFASIEESLARAELSHEQANTLRGDNEQGEATIANLLSQAGLNKASSEVKKTENAIAAIDLVIKGATQHDQIKTIRFQASKAEYESEQAFWDAAQSEQDWRFDAETFKSRVDEQKERVVNLIADTALKAAEKELAQENKKLSAEQRSKCMAETEKIYNDLFFFTDMDFKTAKAYQEWLQTQAAQLPEKLRLMGEELGIQKTKIWVDAGTDILKTAGNAAGLYFLTRGKPQGLFSQKKFQLDTPMQQSQLDDMYKNLQW